MATNLAIMEQLNNLASVNIKLTKRITTLENRINKVDQFIEEFALDSNDCFEDKPDTTMLFGKSPEHYDGLSLNPNSSVFTNFASSSTFNNTSNNVTPCVTRSCSKAK